jgi:hypothetical protein
MFQKVSTCTYSSVHISLAAQNHLGQSGPLIRRTAAYSTHATWSVSHKAAQKLTTMSTSTFYMSHQALHELSPQVLFVGVEVQMHHIFLQVTYAFLQRMLFCLPGCSCECFRLRTMSSARKTLFRIDGRNKVHESLQCTDVAQFNGFHLSAAAAYCSLAKYSTAWVLILGRRNTQRSQRELKCPHWG